MPPAGPLSAINFLLSLETETLSPKFQVRPASKGLPRRADSSNGNDAEALMRGRAYEADVFFWLAWPTFNSTSACDQISQALEVSPNHQPQNGRGLRIQAGLNFEKYTAAVLNAHKHVKAGLVFEVAERNIPPLPRLCLEALVYEI